MNFSETTLQERIKYLRKVELDLTQVEFGDKLGISGSAVTGWEKGNRTPNESTIKLICKEYKVNYAWLVDGVGEIFNSIEKTLIDRLAEEYKLNDIQIRMIEAILELSDDQINMFTSKFFGFEAIKKD